jgi:hypothetical protein
MRLQDKHIDEEKRARDFLPTSFSEAKRTIAGARSQTVFMRLQDLGVERC